MLKQKSAHTSLQRNAEQLLCFNSKFHWKLVHHLTCITVNNATYGLLCTYTTLLAIEKLFLANLAGRRLMFYHCRFILNIGVGKSMCTTSRTKQQTVALTMIAGTFCAWRNLYQTAVTILTVSGRNTFGNNRTTRVATQ